MFISPIKKRRVWPFVTAGVLLVVSLSGFFVYRWLANKNPLDIISSRFVKNYVTDHVSKEAGEAVALLPEILGMEQPKTYLVLFENNTELRPGGGFIGVFAIVTADKGNIRVVEVNATETFDSWAPATWKPTPPEPLSAHLGVDRWYFRDSNWSPDFAESAKAAMELYRGEGGKLGDTIDAVVAITPTVLEQLLELTGPVTVQGITFSAPTVVRDLEYEVEYGYAKHGIAYENRKKIIEPLTLAILGKLKEHVLTSYKRYIVVGQRLAQERQIMVYAMDSKLQTLAAQFESTGTLHETNGDYLLWVDANLAALKTDHAMERSLAYTIEPDGDGYRATATMTYVHMGQFDWRTTRYRTYARVFVPNGAKLVGVEGAMKTDRSVVPGTADQGEELGKRWFGAFIAIEPGDTGTLRFTYHLPASIVQDGVYNLFVQKQLGTIKNGLTVNLNFGTTSTTVQTTDLRVDRQFEVKL